MPRAPWLIAVLPLLCYYLFICVTTHHGDLIVPHSGAEWLALLARIPPPTVSSLAMVGGWFAFQALLQAAAPGRRVEGAVLEDGSRLVYKLNGPWSWWLTWAALLGGVAAGWFPASGVADNLGPLLSAANVLAFAMSVLLWRGGSLSDFFLGTSLNPRFRGFDWKLFCEARPGLLGWIVVDLSLAARQYHQLGTVTVPMALVCLGQLWYVADYFCHEEAVLSTWDIKHERFGWMLCWGSLVWVPFTYTLQALYLVDHARGLSTWAIVGSVCLQTAGYVVFRGANSQKHRFRQNPQAAVWGRPPRVIRTPEGTLLLASGFWGLARHINYGGDLMMALAWCLPTGTRIVPWFYAVYLAVLLVHRERRDGERCRSRYGEAWRDYCAAVPWRIIPGLY